MNRYVASALPLSLSLLVACGGKPAAKAPAAPVDPCAAGLHASGVTASAGTWDAVVAVADATTDTVCENSPCGPDESASFVGSTALAIKVAGGYLVIADVWDGNNHEPTLTFSRLGDLVRVSLDNELLGRDDVTLDDGTTTTATVVTGRVYTDLVVDPGSGKVLFRALCSVEEDRNSQATKLDRAGATFSYTGCEPGATSVSFTAEQAASCPSA